MHYSVVSLRGEAHPAWKGGRVKLNSGYVLKQSPGHPRGVNNYGYVLEHILVMEAQLGRLLLPHENVHHRNGLRDDNRPENLELWARSQPAGQRVQDLLDWAEGFIAQYATEGIRSIERSLSIEPLNQLHNWANCRTVKNYAGYVFVLYPDHPRGRADNGWRVFEHILVMENMLGRYLQPGENVHHRNGVKDDAHSDNLELWLVNQPSGQRVSDLLEWAKSLLDSYGGDPLIRQQIADAERVTIAQV